MTVADYANSDPAVVKSGRVKKAVANAVQQEGEGPWKTSRIALVATGSKGVLRQL